MAAGTWWVGAYIEAGMGASGSSGTPCLPFVFQAANKTQAEADAGAKLLAGPFGSQAQAQTWATDYERNPDTLHAGSGLSPSTGTVKGDNPPAGSLRSQGKSPARKKRRATRTRLKDRRPSPRQAERRRADARGARSRASRALPGISAFHASRISLLVSLLMAVTGFASVAEPA